MSKLRAHLMSELVRSTSAVPLSVALIGPGTVGKALLEQLRVEAPNLLKRHNVDIKVHGITNSSTMILSNEGKAIDLQSWEDRLLVDGTDASLGVLTEHLKNFGSENKVVVDCTASTFVPKFYQRWMEQGIHVVTPNKRLNSGPIAEYQALRGLTKKLKVHYMYEGTVGAGLPIISTLKTLLDTGDSVERIEGIFSGTLSYIFNEFKPGKTFSEVVSGAKRRGYTEPDPRDDLSGMDVTRKVIILARECGTNIELSDVNTESLVPEPLRATPSVPDFMSNLPQHDAIMDARLREADAAGEVLRYVGSYDAESGVCQAGLRRYPKSHPFANLTGSECIVSFTTSRYSTPPLIVRGPGAGPSVTAAGVFGDIITLSRYLGAAS